MHRFAGRRLCLDWRRWTGIEPAGRGSPVPPALKAGEPTRYSDTSTGDGTGHRLRSPRGDDQPCDRGSGRRSMRGMKKLLMLGALAALVAMAVRKVRSI